MDYSKTVNLPRTTFSMKAELVKKEPEIIDFWIKNKIYEKSLEKNKAGANFMLHDGPPYANGEIHIGHALNKILKDIIIKWKIVNGFNAQFIPGWDCHGLPIEHALLKKLNKSRKEIEPISFRSEAMKYAAGYIEIQKRDFIRLGCFGIWDKPYITMDKEYEAKELEVFLKIFSDGYVVKRFKPTLWCIECGTSLAIAEVEYEEKESPSIYVLFRVLSDSFNKKYGLKNSYIIIWTTTPWTLPANKAVALNPDLKYVLKKEGLNGYIAMEGFFEGETIELKNDEFDFNLKNPLTGGVSKLIFDESVEAHATGCVHIAPGHGEEDYIMGLKYGLEVYSPVDEEGKFIGTEYNGMNVFDANPVIIDKLRSADALYKEEKIAHSYPFCWRCKNPVIFRSTEQWFIEIKDDLRQSLLREIDSVRWIPDYGRERIYSMVSNRPDWCISRQRVWGVPIPEYYCTGCGRSIINEKIIEEFISMVRENGSDVWFTHEPPPCIYCGAKTVKLYNTLDVWFDSGTSFYSSGVGFEKPVLYLEGSDQHRGWFQASLILGTAFNNKAPYDEVLTHGFVVDELKQKMSKSLGNVVSPQDVIKKYGAEVLRIWVASSNYSEDVSISDGILKKFALVYIKTRNTIRFMLANLYDFKGEVEINDIYSNYILYEFENFRRQSIEALDNYNFSKFMNILVNFIETKLSREYFDVCKDILYCEAEDSYLRREVQSALYRILKEMLVLISPVYSFLAEEAWQEGRKTGLFLEESVFLARISNVFDVKNNFPMFMFDIRKRVYIEIEDLKSKGVIENPLDAMVEIYLNDEKFIKIKDYTWHRFFKVSEVIVKPGAENIVVKKSIYEKCKRCWLKNSTVSDGICLRCRKVVGL